MGIETKKEKRKQNQKKKMSKRNKSLSTQEFRFPILCLSGHIYLSFQHCVALLRLSFSLMSSYKLNLTFLSLLGFFAYTLQLKNQTLSSSLLSLSLDISFKLRCVIPSCSLILFSSSFFFLIICFNVSIPYFDDRRFDLFSPPGSLCIASTSDSSISMFRSFFTMVVNSWCGFSSLFFLAGSKCVCCVFWSTVH